MFGIIRAPDLDQPSVTWINHHGSKDLKAYRGRIVLLDFFTPCCINCRHTQATLNRLEQRFGDALRVFSIHSPKYDWERDPNSLSLAMETLNISHTVIHDPNFVLWDLYAVKAWPSLVIIAPDGRIVGTLRGEPSLAKLETGIAQMIAHAKAVGSFGAQEEASSAPSPDRPCATSKKTAVTAKAQATPTQPTSPDSPAEDPVRTDLRRPMGLTTGPWPGCVTVADTGNNRIVVFDQDGVRLASYGRADGSAGFQDGPSQRAAFHEPIGVLCTGEDIWVADTGNHAVRRIRPHEDQVETLLGTGERGLPMLMREPGKEAALASPWDLAGLTQAQASPLLYIANAGTHQILAYDPTRDTVRPLVGSGAEGMADGPGDEAILAQPSGLSLNPDGTALYFTDSESSSLRVMDTSPPYRVRSLIGAGLFDFGGADGGQAAARMQHPLALSASPDGVWLADSYNHRLRFWNESQNHLSTPQGPWLHSMAGGTPGGILWLSKDRVLIADTAHHRLLLLDLARGAVTLWGRLPSGPPHPRRGNAVSGVDLKAGSVLN